MARKSSLNGFSGLRNNPGNITKKDIVDFVAARTGQTKKATKETIDTLLDVIKDAAKSGKYITFAGFGTFRMEKRKGYTRKLTAKQKKMLGVRKSTIRVPASKRLVFSASKK